MERESEGRELKTASMSSSARPPQAGRPLRSASAESRPCISSVFPLPLCPSTSSSPFTPAAAACASGCSTLCATADGIALAPKVSSKLNSALESAWLAPPSSTSAPSTTTFWSLRYRSSFAAAPCEVPSLPAW